MEMIDFCHYDAEEMLDGLIEEFEKGSADANGNFISLTEGDERVILLSCMNYLCEVMVNNINKMANNNFVVLADEASLIYKGIERNVYRLEAEPSKVNMEFVCSALAPEAVTVPAGTKVTADGKVFFQTDENVLILPGETVEIECTSTVASSSANGYSVGSIKTLVNTIPFIESVANTSVSAGGSDLEDIEAFRDRVWAAPLAYTVAGTKDAYAYHAKEVSATIHDVVAYNHVATPNDVYIYVLCKNGELPSEELCTKVKDYIEQDEIKALTDNINVLPAVAVEYTVDLSFKVGKPYRMRASEIEARVNEEIRAYISQIGSVMGVPVNPEMLVRTAYNAGAASVTINAPGFTELKEYEVAVCTSVNITYDGILG